jgi:hypothetical protein
MRISWLEMGLVPPRTHQPRGPLVRAGQANVAYLYIESISQEIYFSE